ncbi:MAG: hypothetical protein CL763_10260 [Chloroflexi bacterium]|nr:hypothetical protein [Chloroflexota bacterium]
MLLISQNVTNYDLDLPKNAVFRINLAWCNSLEELENILQKNRNNEIFIDLPIGRIKPPNNRYTLEEMIPIINTNDQIKYFAVSNVESKEDLTIFQEKLPQHVNIIPKIESPNAINNIQEITDSLNSKEKIIMLDHDDLFSSIIRNNEDKDNFKKYIINLIDYCEKNNISLLRTVGVVFSDDEKRITQYEK